MLQYVWREDQAGKDSDIIASAVHHALTGSLAARLEDVNVLRVFSDSWFGQNKNMAMMSMLLSLATKQPAGRQ